MKAIIYGRFSTMDQDTGDSERRQSSGAHALCQRKKWDIAEELLDKGKSGFHGANIGKKAKLGDFLARVQEGKIGRGYVLVFENWDRFSRQPFSEVYPRIQSLLKKGLWLASVSPEVILTPENADDLNTILMFTMPIVLGYEESRKKSERLGANWQNFRNNLKPGDKIPGQCAPWLYWKDGYKVHPDKAAIVQKIFALALSGIPTKAITRQLNKEKVPTLTGLATWPNPSVGNILRSKTVIGTYEATHKEQVVKTVPGFFPAIVSEDHFWRVQSLLAKRTTKNNIRGNDAVTNLFTGLLTNTQDNSSAVVCKGGHGSPTLYSSANWRGASDVPSFNYTAFENAFLQWFKELSVKDLVGDEQSSDLTVAEGAVAKIEAKIEALKKRVAENPDYTSFLDLLVGAEGEKKAAVRKLDEIRAKSYMNRAALEHKDTVSLLDLLAGAKGNDLLLLRQKIKGRIAQLVKAIGWKVYKQKRIKFAAFGVELNSGYCRMLFIMTTGATNAQTTQSWVVGGSSKGFPLEELKLAGIDEAVIKAFA